VVLLQALASQIEADTAPRPRAIDELVNALAGAGAAGLGRHRAAAGRRGLGAAAGGARPGRRLNIARRPAMVCRQRSTGDPG
jgi:hypothetical protein